MVNENTVDAQPPAATLAAGPTDAERTIPLRADILETEDEVLVVADVPGVGEDSLEVTIARDVLTILARAGAVGQAGMELIYSECTAGTYERSFSLSEEIDKDRVQAVVKDGVLRVSLPKLKPSTRRIVVDADRA